MNADRRVVILDPLFDDLEVEARTARELGWRVERWDTDPASLKEVQVVAHVRTRVDRALMAAMPKLRVVGRFGTGLDSVDQDAAAARGIGVVGVRDYCVPELASHTLGLAFSLDRRISDASAGRLSPDQAWQDVAATFPIPGRARATVVGLGAIGSAVTRALLACAFEVRVVTRHGAAEARAMGAVPADLDDGLTDVGFVFLHAALTRETVSLIDARRLAGMSTGTILVDTARLGLLDEGAVADALHEGRLAGLALDAKLAPDSPLRSLLGDPRMLVTPHIGWYSERSARELRMRTIQETIAVAEPTMRRM